MDKVTHRLLLADDDIDDCMFFRDALDELPVTTSLVTAKDGVHLMQLLKSGPENIPDILFLDLNMPRKNGFDCLAEIKKNKEFSNLPVIIFSTSLDPNVVNNLYEMGAHFYLRKPGEFSRLKQLIHYAIELVLHHSNKQPQKEDFVIKNRK